jgi:hypothetical protein
MFRIMGLAEEQVPETALLGLLFQLLNHWDDCFPPLFWIIRQLDLRQSPGRKYFVLFAS